MSNLPFLAPGCFGSALMFKGSDMVCAACTMKAECEPVHLVSLKRLRDALGIVVQEKPAKVSTKKQEEVSEDPTRLSLPKKVRELLRQIDETHLDIVEKMKNGENPFRTGKFQFLKVAAHLIMHLKSPVTHKVLVAGMVAKLEHKTSTADAHARMAIQALVHVGAITNDDGILRVRYQ